MINPHLYHQMNHKYFYDWMGGCKITNLREIVSTFDQVNYLRQHHQHSIFTGRENLIKSIEEMAL